jgi:hypothetical protein
MSTLEYIVQLFNLYLNCMGTVIVPELYIIELCGNIL